VKNIAALVGPRQSRQAHARSAASNLYKRTQRRATHRALQRRTAPWIHRYTTATRSTTPIITPNSLKIMERLEVTVM
jgi:hypothetical protein